MRIGSRAGASIALAGLALLAACASAPPTVELPPGTWVLGEVRHVLTRPMVESGEFAPGDVREGLAAMLLDAGFTDTQIDAGRVIVFRDRIEWNNTASGIRRSVLKAGLVVDGLAVAPGNVVEIEVAQRPWSIVRRVRAVTLEAGGCYYGDVPVGALVEAMGAISLVGPRGSASLYCSGIENEGWQRPRTYWHRLPGAAPAQAATPAPQAVRSGDEGTLPPSPPAQAASDGLATLMLLLQPRDPGLWFFSPLPVWVDDRKVAELEQGACGLVRVPPGEHRVMAGLGFESDLMRRYGRRALDVSVGAGDRVVLEYRVDVKALLQSERLFESRAKWEPLVYHFTQRPATPQDTCAVRYMTPTLGP